MNTINTNNSTNTNTCLVTDTNSVIITDNNYENNYVTKKAKLKAKKIRNKENNSNNNNNNAFIEYNSTSTSKSPSQSSASSSVSSMKLLEKIKSQEQQQKALLLQLKQHQNQLKQQQEILEKLELAPFNSSFDNNSRIFSHENNSSYRQSYRSQSDKQRITSPHIKTINNSQQQTSKAVALKCSFENSDFVYGCNDTLKKYKQKLKFLNSVSPESLEFPYQYHLYNDANYFDYTRRYMPPVLYTNNCIHNHHHGIQTCCSNTHGGCHNYHCSNNMQVAPLVKSYKYNRQEYYQQQPQRNINVRKSTSNMKSDGTVGLSTIPLSNTNGMINYQYNRMPNNMRPASIPSVPIPTKPIFMKITNKANSRPNSMHAESNIQQVINKELYRNSMFIDQSLVRKEQQNSSTPIPINIDRNLLSNIKNENLDFAKYRQQEYERRRQQNQQPHTSSIIKNFIETSSFKDSKNIEKSTQTQITQTRYEVNGSSSNDENKVQANLMLKYNDSLSSLDDFIRSPYNYYKNPEINNQYNSDYSSDSISVGNIDTNKINYYMLNSDNLKNYMNIVNQQQQQKDAVYESPTFLLMPKSFVGKYGTNAKFKCSFIGYPLPRVTWFLNGQNLNQINKPYKYKLYFKRNGVFYLKLFNLKLNDSGKITCRLENCMGHVEACANLIVLNDQGDQDFTCYSQMRLKKKNLLNL